MAAGSLLLHLLVLAACGGGVTASTTPSTAGAASSCPAVGSEAHDLAQVEVQAAEAAEAALAETSLLQRRLADAGQKATLTNDEERLVQALREVRRDHDWAKFLESTKDFAGVKKDASGTQRSMPRKGAQEQLLQLDSESRLNDLASSVKERLQDIKRSGAEAAAPTVTLPSGATVTGSVLPGVLVNATMGVDGFDMAAVVQAYVGVKYATAERFMAPELYDYEAGDEVDGTVLGEQCAQSYYTQGVLAGSEDCLFANIYSPMGTEAGAGKPVIVWIHGGNLVFGSANQYHGILNWLASEGDVIMVAINYRLNVFGFFYSPEGKMKANFGNRDQIKALEWVQKNIAAFGGDKNRVTIMGQSGGGRSVSVLYMSPMSVGLFHRAIAQSPGALDANYFQPIKRVGSKMGYECQKAAGCYKKGVSCMREKSAEEINSACSVYTHPDNYLAKYGYYMSGWDGEVLPHRISNPLCQDTPVANRNVPMMSGSLANEWTYFDLGSSVLQGVNMVRRLFHEHLPAYHRGLGVRDGLESIAFGSCIFGNATCTGNRCHEMSDAASLQMASNQYGLGVLFPLHGRGTGKRYRYDLNIDLGGSALGSGHCGELCLLFSSKPWNMPFQKGPCGDGGHQEEWTELSKIMRSYWLNFAKDGVPSAEGYATWTQMYQKRRSPMMSLELGKPPKMTNEPPFSHASEDLLVLVMCNDAP